MTAESADSPGSPVPPGSSALPSWPREFYAPGGGDPFLFYVIYGDIDFETPFPGDRFRTAGIPPGIEVMSYGPDSEHPEVPESFREGFLWEELVREDPEFAARIAATEHCTVIRGTPDNEASLDYLRDVVGLITCTLERGGVAVYDPQMFRWWAPRAWRKTLFEPATAVPRQHVVILASPEEALASPEEDASLEWIHTRGMRKFGRPDLSIAQVPGSLRPTVIDLINRLIEHQALGAVIEEGQEIRMESLPEGMICIHGGDLDDPDFNNVHVEICWRGGLR